MFMFLLKSFMRLFIIIVVIVVFFLLFITTRFLFKFGIGLERNST